MVNGIKSHGKVQENTWVVHTYFVPLTSVTNALSVPNQSGNYIEMGVGDLPHTKISGVAQPSQIELQLRLAI